MRKETLEFSRKNKFFVISGVIWVLGMLSILVRPFGYETTLTSWVDNWGTKTGWIIRISMFLGGLVGVIIAIKEQIKYISNNDHLPPNEQISNE